MRGCSPTRPATITSLDNRLVAYDVRASIAHAEMLAEQGLLSAADLAAIRDALAAIGAEHAAGQWRVTLEQEDCQTAIENRLTERSARPAAACMPAARATIRCSWRCACICATRRRRFMRGAMAVAEALDALASRQGGIALPGYTHMQQAMPSTVALWALGFAAEIRDDAEGLRAGAAPASARTRWARPRATARPISTSAANRRGGASTSR